MRGRQKIQYGWNFDSTNLCVSHESDRDFTGIFLLIKFYPSKASKDFYYLFLFICFSYNVVVGGKENI